ncbi:MAG: ZIP family metal transporter [Saccharofermentanales bacterium]|jgi:ZIP family zinc transporter|nr:ZIP family metal transporter [Bacillota bacterium]
MTFLTELDPVLQALLGTLFTWGMTALGAALVFFFRRINKIVLNAMLGFASGVMIAASFWSLLQPAIVMAEQIGQIPYLVAALGFLAGGGFLMLVDHLLPHMHSGLGKNGEVHGPKTNLRRSILLVLAITIHNIPEGLAVGVAFGAAAAGIEGAELAGALALALGIGLQNFPEGAAVSIPLRREGMRRSKAFFYGQMSGIVEPISAVIGVLAVQAFQRILPFALAFAAGAMIYVVVEELIPEAQRQETEELEVKTDVATIGVMLGFTVMMILDVALG